MEYSYYPINDFGPAMKGLVIGSVAIVHVFLAQFAIGGGMLMCYFEWLSQTGRCRRAREFVDGYFKFLVLISFVVGAVTGVGMWFTTIQISARTIGMMVHEFHWFWATEWTFFCLEIVSGYCFYRYSTQLAARSRLILLGIYSLAAWFSLFWINGILAWQLTPGDWLTTGSIWSGFFNPSFFPSLVFRTVVSMTIAALVACVVINIMPDVDRNERTELINRAAHFLAPMMLMPLLGLWYFASIPAASREWAAGGSPAMSMFLAMAVGASLLIGAYAFLGLIRHKLYVNAATAALLCALAFVATAGGEFVREGVRKPFTIHGVLYSNSIRADEAAELRRTGSVTNDPYPLADGNEYPNEQLRLGGKVFRFQCSVCHTIDGANGLKHLTGTWTLMQKRLNIAKLQRTKPFMPPFAGTSEELEALVQLISWQNAGSPEDWPVSEDQRALAQIQSWLDEVGTEPATGLVHTASASSFPTQAMIGLANDGDPESRNPPVTKSVAEQRGSSR